VKDNVGKFLNKRQTGLGHQDFDSNIWFWQVRIESGRDSLTFIVMRECKTKQLTTAGYSHQDQISTQREYLDH
jgi:hypothetical protein